MFRAVPCSSSEGQIVLLQPLVSSLSVNSRTVCRLRVHSQPAHCTAHSVGASGRVIGLSQRPVPDNTQRSQQTRHRCCRQKSNQQSQQKGGRRPTPWTARPLGSAPMLYMCLNTVAPWRWLWSVAETCRSTFAVKVLMQLAGNELVFVYQLQWRCT